MVVQNRFQGIFRNFQKFPVAGVKEKQNRQFEFFAQCNSVQRKTLVRFQSGKRQSGGGILRRKEFIRPIINRQRFLNQRRIIQPFGYFKQRLHIGHMPGGKQLLFRNRIIVRAQFFFIIGRIAKGFNISVDSPKENHQGPFGFVVVVFQTQPAVFGAMLKKSLHLFAENCQQGFIFKDDTKPDKAIEKIRTLFIRVPWIGRRDGAFSAAKFVFAVADLADTFPHFSIKGVALFSKIAGQAAFLPVKKLPEKALRNNSPAGKFSIFTVIIDFAAFHLKTTLLFWIMK